MVFMDFSLTVKVFLCMFCMLVVPIHYSDDGTNSWSAKFFQQKVFFLITVKVFGNKNGDYCS